MLLQLIIIKRSYTQEPLSPPKFGREFVAKRKSPSYLNAKPSRPLRSAKIWNCQEKCSRKTPKMSGRQEGI